VALWCLGYPEAAFADANLALGYAREMSDAGGLLLSLFFGGMTHFLCGSYATTETLAHELYTFSDEQGAVLWKSTGQQYRGWVLAVTGRAPEAAQLLVPSLAAFHSTGSTGNRTFGLALLGKSYADLDQPDDALRSVNEAKDLVERTEDRLWEAEVHRIAGEIMLQSPQPDAAKAEAHFERALMVARQQEAKSWELRAAMSMARLWRDQGKRQQARELLAPIYGWFTEGFDTRDLKEAKALLEEIASA
jgi:tetratricopeptide (TPR) repeat protein